MDQCPGSFSLSVKLINHGDNLEWWLTRIYGPCASPLKSEFLAELTHLQSVVSSIWVMGGDFNITRYSHEYSARPKISPIMSEFNNFIASAGLIDFSPNNCQFTWFNFQATLTMVKLDKFLVSQG